MSEPPSNVTTWAALLAHWTAFAQASAALPKDAEGTRWLASTPAIIGLHAVTLALQDLASPARAGASALPPDERGAAILRASAIIERYHSELRALWPELDVDGAGPAVLLRELVGDARAAIAALIGAGNRE
jgi:hypothetical protein